MSNCNSEPAVEAPRRVEAPSASQGARKSLGYASGGMLLTDAPDLPLVIGLPVLLMLAAFAAAIGTFIVLARLRG